jgi:hypothetical protein
MLLDTILYIKSKDAIGKTVVHVEDVKDVEKELEALKAQLEVFEKTEQLPEIIMAASNYKEQISILEEK